MGVVMPFMLKDVKSCLALIASSKMMSLEVSKHVTLADENVPWEIVWECLIRTRFIIGTGVLDTRLKLKKMIKFPMSRLCRGCGQRTYRLVMGYRVCEFCTLRQDRTFHMVPYAHVLSCFPAAASWNILTHRGRRSRMCFMHDVCVATELLVRLYDENPQR